eukprot:TRINITY_DN9157_c0_g1_i1.p1 TRINITY_DN9157_c0_g1~~TRINITY_DN9157_c0_g1_i1.p1  ORF type:complete len:470 (+),score=97.45 TRINITY_DN9157_c0_g1_i1:33-1412(+)
MESETQYQEILGFTDTTLSEENLYRKKISQVYGSDADTKTALSPLYYQSSKHTRLLYQNEYQQERAMERYLSHAKGLNVFVLDLEHAYDFEYDELAYLPLKSISVDQVFDLPITDRDAVSALLKISSKRDDLVFKPSVRYFRDLGFAESISQVDFDYYESSFGYQSSLSKNLSSITRAKGSIRYEKRKGTNMNVNVERDLYFSERSISKGFLECQIGSQTYVGTGVRTSTEYLDGICDIKLNEKNVQFTVGGVVRFFTKYFVNFRSKLRLDSKYVRIELWKKISDFVSFGSGILLGTSGFELIFGFSTQKQNFYFPVRLSSEFDLKTILFYGGVSMVVSLICSSFILEPLKKKGESLKISDEKSIIEKNKAMAMKYQNSIQNYISSRLGEEIDKGGLVIVRALYGNLEHLQKFNGKQADIKLESDLVPSYHKHSEIIEVTKPLQYFVENSFSVWFLSNW